MTSEPQLTAAALIQHLVSDLLHQQKFPYAHFPELVDLAVVMMGLGTLRTQFEFVKRADIFWDSTYWGVFPRPFLDTQALGYAYAMSAWIRNEGDANWFADLPPAVKTPAKKSLKFLTKTGESFFNPDSVDKNLLEQESPKWLTMANDAAVSTQVIAMRHFEKDESETEKQQEIILSKLQSPNETLVAHAITSAESLQLTGEPIVNELNHLIEHRSDEIRAKSMIALTKLGCSDESTVAAATKMIDSNAKHVVFAGMFALSAQPQVDEATLKVVDRGFLSALQTCDYEFIQLYTSAYDRWLESPESHLQQLLSGAEEYLEIAMESLEAAREQTVSLG